MMGAPAVGGLLLIIILAPWNYLQMPGDTSSDIPSVPVEGNLENENAVTESTETVSEVNDSSNNDSTDTILNEPSIESNSDPVIEDSTPAPVIEEPANDIVPDIVVSEQQDSSSVTYASGGGSGHRSSHSSNSNSGNNAEDDVGDQEGSGSGGSNSVPPEEPDEGIDEDESIFVLPESPIGSVLILVSSLAAMSGFLAFKARRLA